MAGTSLLPHSVIVNAVPLMNSCVLVHIELRTWRLLSHQRRMVAYVQYTVMHVAIL